MSIVPYSGRLALAASIKQRPVQIAWGAGEEWWDERNAAILTLDETGRTQLPVSPIKDVSVFLNDTEMELVRDYILAPLTGQIVRTLDGAIPNGATLRIEYKAGRPAMSGQESRLVAELGRREANSVQFVVPDENGSIITSGKNRWSVSETPTRFLHINVAFAAEDEPYGVIREMGVFIDGMLDGSGATDSGYYPVTAVTDPGTLFILTSFPPLIQSGAEGRSRAFIATF